MPRPWLRLLDPELHDAQEAARDGAFEARFRVARLLNQRARHEESAALLDKLLAEDRSHPDAWFERIIAAGETAPPGELRSLHDQMESIRDEHPDACAPRRNLAYVRILQGRLDDAERAVRQALERDPVDVRSIELQGLMALQKDQPDEALGHLGRALDLKPTSARIMRLQGVAFQQKNDLPSAEARFAAALAAAPCYFWGWHSLGELLLRRGDVVDGYRCIMRARGLNPRETASYFILSELFAEQGHLEMAQAELHRLVLMAPEPPTLAEAYALLGEYRRDLGDREGAISYFSLASSTDQDAPNPWAALGDMAREEERWEDALRCYEEALSRDPEAADIRVQSGYISLKQGDLAQAERQFLRALEADPGEYSAYLGLSECYRHLNRPEDQAGMVQQAMTLAPDDPDVWNAQGVALEVKGQFVEATTAYERALGLAPNHRKAANNLGFLLEKRMQAGEADLKSRALDAWKRRLLICRDENQSMKMAYEHLLRLGIREETLQEWIDSEVLPA